MIEGKKVLCIIIARAGSEGVKGKNFRPLNGIPLITHSINSAINSKLVDKVAINSNCSHIKGLSAPFLDSDKVVFIDRPDALATATSKNESSLLQSYYYCKYTYNFDADYIVHLQPTSPMRGENLIDSCIEAVDDSGGDSLITVKRMTPLFWKVRKKVAHPQYDYKNRPMRQDVRDEDWMFHDNGNIYITSRDVLTDKICRTGDNPILFETSGLESFQVDSEFDFLILETIIRLRDNEKDAFTGEDGSPGIDPYLA